jgi:hypothetical protein
MMVMRNATMQNARQSNTPSLCEYDAALLLACGAVP